MDRNNQFRAGGNACPSARDLPFFRADIFKADGAHLLQTPLDSLSGFWRSGHAAANVVRKFFQVVIGFIAHHSLPGNGGERGHGTVLGRSGGFSRIGGKPAAELVSEKQHRVPLQCWSLVTGVYAL